MSSSSASPESWISSFCSLLGHEYFAEVSEDFIEDDFNLTGLQGQVPMYKEALEMILDVEPEEDDEEDEEEDDEDPEESIGDGRRIERRHNRMASDLSIIESSAELLYGLIHQRYICSRAGIQQMSEKYELSHFGNCPRTNCDHARTLPVGLSDVPGEDTVKLFCPSCLDVYVPPNSRFQTVDGAFFGRTFGALFLMTFPDYDLSKKATEALTSSRPSENEEKPTINGMLAHNLGPGLGRGKVYEPRIYGFRVSERARSGPRMQWLRSRPDNVQELNEARIYHDEDVEGDEEMVGVSPDSEFVRVCGEYSSDPEQGNRVANMLDEAGNVIVLGKLVCLKPEELTSAMAGLIPTLEPSLDAETRQEFEQLEIIKSDIDKRADDLVRKELWAGLGLIMAQTVGFFRLTFWELSWDVMEPICFYVTSTYFMAGYAFFLRTSKEPSFEGFYKSRFETKQKRLIKMLDFDIDRFTKLQKMHRPNLTKSGRC